MLTINGCRIIPIDGPVIEQGAIQIERTMLRAVRPSPVTEPGGELLDARGMTAIPGMGQMHGHFSGYMHTMDTGPINAQPHTLKAIQATAFARNALNAGITMWREVGAHAHIDLQLKKAINLGLVPGPRMQAAGRWLGHTGGHGTGLNEQVDGPEALRQAVREQVAAGADGIKLIASGGVMNATEDPFGMEYSGVWDRKLEYFMRAAKAGVKFATGTDTGAPRVFHHELALELELMVQVGLTHEQTLRAATASCAELMGWSDTLGTLTPGKEADVVLLDGNPLEDISATRRVRHVFKAGKHYTPEPPVPPLPW